MTVLREMSTPVEVQQIRKWNKGKLNVLIYGSMGLPQHTVKGYKLYISEKDQHYTSGKMYQLPDIKPGQQVNFEVDEVNEGNVIRTIVRPLVYLVTQKSFYWSESDK